MFTKRIKRANLPLSVYLNSLLHPWWSAREGCCVIVHCPVANSIVTGSVVLAARPGRHWRGRRSRDPRSLTLGARRLRGASFQLHKTTHCTLHSPLSTHALRSSRSSNVPSARRTFELVASPALAYKYEARWRGLASDHDASRIHIGINWRCSRCPPRWFY